MGGERGKANSFFLMGGERGKGAITTFIKTMKNY
ncbi:hypothetical protein X927_01640 [Petrotoga mexicana DSM 14811]|uniref:Uncharacterized protein n=1 Tax=Petrotoga mexicana DSM 14811 TaxID=1122954 RepID=A0A2K1PE85_9BACT|nr:hypothetical protein X927_01640 [Petrotoga mexicana DSM 14811]